MIAVAAPGFLGHLPSISDLLFARAIITSNSLCKFCVSMSYINTIFNQSACMFSQDCFLNVSLSVFDTNACPLARGKYNYVFCKCISCTSCPFGQVVKDDTRAAGTRKSNSFSKIKKHKIQQLQQNHLNPFLKF